MIRTIASSETFRREENVRNLIRLLVFSSLLAALVLASAPIQAVRADGPEPPATPDASTSVHVVSPPPPALTGDPANVGGWLDGSIQWSTIENCVSIIQGSPYYEKGAGTYVGYYMGGTGQPTVGSVYYLHVVFEAVGNACSGQKGYVDIALPPNTSLAISASTPVYCFANGVAVTPASDCPQVLPTSPYNSGMYDIEAPGPDYVWPMPIGVPWEFQIPVRSTATLSNSSFQAKVWVLDGNSSPWLTPSYSGLFVFAPPAPAAFSKSGPVNGATGVSTSPTLSWGASAGAASYAYCIDTVNDNACNAAWVSTGAATSKALSGLAAGTHYYWQVRATNAGGTTYANGGATAWWSFTTSAALAPVFKATPTSWNFGLVKVGTTSAATSFTIKNVGTANMVIGTVTLGGTSPTQFHLTTNSCSGHTLIPHATCSVAATFAPTLAGAKSAYINIPDNAAGHPHKIPLAGKGATDQSLNGGFNTYPTSTLKVPTNWRAVNFASTDGKNTLYKVEGTASVRIGNTAARTKTLTQTRLVSGGAGSSFVFSLSGRGQSIPTTAGLVQAQVQLFNGTTLVLTKTIVFPNGSYGFTRKVLGFTAPAAYTKILIKLTYSKASGAIWFDALSLLRSP